MEKVSHDPVRAGRPPVTGQRWNDHIVVVGKLCKTLEPARHTQFAMDHQQRCAAAAAPQLDCDTWNGSSRGAMHAFVAATPACAFQTMTASPRPEPRMRLETEEPPARGFG